MGCTACDAIVASEHMIRVTTLQMAVGAPDLDAIGVLDRLLPEPEAVQRTFVYAAVGGYRAKDLAERDVARRALADVDPRLKVGWMNIGNLNGNRKAVLVSFIVYGRIVRRFGVEGDPNRSRSRWRAGTKRLGKSGLRSGPNANELILSRGWTLKKPEAEGAQV